MFHLRGGTCVTIDLVAGRNIPLITGEDYHVFYRGGAQQPTFISHSDYQQALLGLNYYRFISPPIKLSRFKRFTFQKKAELLSKLDLSGNKWVDIISFVLMPNHFHLLLKQTTDKGIAKYLSLFTNSYTRYFNTKGQRPGPVFQGVFKAVHVESNEQLLHLSRYIHLNPYVSGVTSKTALLTYPWSSLPCYLGEEKNIVDQSIVLSQFKSSSGYKDFVINHADYAQQLEFIKHLTIDTEL